MSSARSLAIQKSTLQYFIWRGPWSTLQECATWFCGTDSKLCQFPYNVAHYITTIALFTLAKEDACMQAIKAAVAFYSDILGAAAAWWILLFLSFYMLYTSYTNLNKHKACLAINNPSVILWTRYLVRLLSCQKNQCGFVFDNIHIKSLSVCLDQKTSVHQ